MKKITAHSFRLLLSGLFFMLMCTPSFVYSQELTISSTGETEAPGTNWSISGTNPVTITATGGSANVNTSVIIGYLNNGISVIVHNNNLSGNVVLTSDLTKSSGGDASLTLRANTQSVVSAPITSTSSKINVILWSDYNNSNVGGVALSAAAVINTNGGHFWAGGSSSPAGSYTWNGLTVGNGPSVGSIDANNYGMDIFTSQINTNGGHILLWSGTGHGSVYDGIGMQNNPHLNAGSGNVTLITRQIFNANNTLSVTTTGKLALATDASNPWTSDFNWATTTSGSNVTLTSALGQPLQINNFSSLGGLSVGVYDGFGSSFNYTNLQNVNINSSIDILGPINVYAGVINYGIGVEVTARTATGTLNFQAKSGFFTVANTVGDTRGKLMTPDGGDIIINADADNNNSGQLNIDWLTIDGRAGNILLEGSTFTWNTSAQVTLPEFYSTLGTLTIRNVTSSNYAINTQWIAMFGTYSGVTFGRDGGTEAVLLNSCTVCASAALNYGTTAFQIAGPIAAYGGNINVNFNLIATSSDSDILLKATKSIVVGENVSVQTNNGDITFWSNSDGVGNDVEGDFIGLYSGVSINSANGLTTQTSGGGTITMAGGSTNQILASGTVVPTGYAYSSRTTNWIDPVLPPGGVNFGEKRSSEGALNTLNIYSGGGDIVVKGKSNSSSAGVQWLSGSTGAIQVMNSGNGTIYIDGSATSTNAHGIEFMSYASVVYPTIISSNPSSAAISIKGETLSTIDRSGYQGAVKLEANAIGGGIEINGKVPSSSNYGAIEAGTLNAYALSGPITFISEGGLGLIAGGVWGQGTLASSSSNITLKSDKIALYPTTIETTGTLTVEPLGTSFASALTFPITNLTLGNTVSGLTLGKSTNTANITFANATTIAGPITAYGGDIAVNENLNTSAGAANGTVLLKASGNIIQAASKTITTSDGDVTLWSDSDGNGSGYIQLTGGATSGIFSGGGNVVLGGGLDITTGYARGAAIVDEGTFDTYISGVHLRNGSTINSDGGTITLRGQNFGDGQSRMQFGISGYNTTLDAGDGKISLTGLAGGSGGSGAANAQGISSWPINTAGQGWTIRSTNPDADAISLSGDASSCNNSNTSLGINFHGTIEATGGGGIYMYGKASTAAVYDQPLDIYGNILANSGPITIVAENNVANQTGLYLSTNATLGSKTGTNVPSSSSNIILKSDNTVFNVATPINTSGTVTILPLDASTSFGAAQTLGSNTVFSSNVSGLTIGKPSNTANITFGSTTNIAGPITVYGGDIAVNENLNTTAGNANGDVLLKSAATISIAASKSIITNGGNITFWADNDANGTGGIKVDDNVTIDSRTNTDRTGNAHTTGGGKITFAGGLDDGGTASGTSLLTTGLVSNDGFPDGYAVNSGSGSSTTPNTGIVLGTIPTTPAGHNSNINIFSGSGDIRFNGLVTNNTGATVNDPTGLLFFHGYTINGGTSGNVILLGNSSVTSANGCIGMDLAAWRENSYTADGIVRTVNGSINVVGRASGGTSHNLAIAIDATNTNGIKRNIFAATGSGSISIDGLATGTSPLDVRLTNVDLLSGSGAITTIARGTSGIHIGGYNIGDGLFIGQKSGSLVESSTSAISLIADNIQLTKPLITNSTGALIFESLSNSFTSNITLTNKTTTAHSSLRIGKITNAFNISIGGTTSIAGPIDVYGRNIYINDNLNTTAGNANGDVLLKSTADISVAASKSITTNAGDVILWSDSDSNNNGSISLLSAATIQTSGGKIVLAGGSDDGSNSGIASDGIPDGYSKGVGVAGISTTGSFNLNSGSGDILLRGSSDTLNGVLLSAATSGSINSEGGKIDIIGLVDVGSVINGGPSQTGIRTIGGGTITLDSGSGLLSLLGNGPRSGIGFGLNNANETDAATQTILTSSNTTAAAISIKGTGVHGITFRGATTKLHATAALGGITIDANSTIWSSTIYNPVEILAVSGPINWLNSTSSDGIYSETTSIALGSKSGVSGLTSSSSNINFYLNKLYGTPALAFGTTGQVKIQGVDGTASFGQAFNTNTFGLNSNAQTMSAFTFGTPANTNDLTFGSATSIAGPITAYGGTITLNANLTTTNNGDISLYTDNPIAGLVTPRTLTAAGAFKYIPRGTTFSADVTYPIANLTATSTGLTIGNATNDKNITIDADVTGGAGIELYGNNVNINSNLTTTGTSAIMHLKGNTTIAAGKTITSGGNFTHDGNLTFKSDVNGTAAFGTFGGTTFTKQSGITTVERYVPAKRAWRLLTAPLKGTSNATVPNNWQGVDGEGLLLFSPATYQSQTMTGYTTGGGMPNIWKYNSSNNSWLSIPNITTENLFTSTVNNGFLVFATGASNSTNIVSGADITTLKPQGDLITGVVEHSLSADKYHLIGNPYASPLNTEAMVQANAGTKVYMVDPTLGTVGGYVTYDGSNWAPTEPTLNDKNIQSGQGFFVRSTSNTTFTITESDKVVGNSNTWFARSGSNVSEDTSTDKIRVLLYKQVDSQWQLADGILAVNSTSGNNEVDATDTGKMTNFNENIAFRNGTSNLSIEYRVLPTTETIQPMRLTGTTIQPYQLRVKTENYSNSDLQPYLEDTQTGVLTLIPIDGSEVVVNFTGIAAISSNPDSRFRIVYPSTLGIGDPNTLAVGVYPNPVEEDVFTILLPDNGVPANYTLTNLLGQQVQQGKLDMLQNSVSVSMLQGGVYLLQVVQSGKTFTSKLIIK